MPKGHTRPILTIRRKGTLNVPGLQPRNKCGRPDQTTFDFSLKIQVRELDGQGFVCDQFDIPRLLAEHFATGEWEASCEQLAGSGIYIMHKICKGRALSIEFEVSPTREAGVMVEWRKGWALPSFFADKTREVRRRPRSRTEWGYRGDKLLSCYS